MKTIYMSGEIGWDVMPDDIRSQIDSKSKEAIRVIINSPGGYVSDGLEIYNILKAYKGKVEIVIGVMAASIAAYIAMAASLENRKAFKNSSFMIHEASGGCWGRARDMKIISERLDGINNISAEAFAEGLGVTKEKALEMMSEDNYFTGWEALVENNVISDIIDIEEVDIPQKEEEEDGIYYIFETMKASLEKEPEISILKSQMYETEDKMQKEAAKKNDIEKAVAMLEIKTEHKPEIKPEENKSEGTMDLKEFLNSNPEAKAEYETALQTAEEKGKESVKAEFSDDRKRIANILELSGVTLSDVAIEAIENNLDAGEFAKQELLTQKNKRADVKPSPFSELATKQLPGDQSPEEKAEVKEEGKFDEEKMKKNVKDVFARIGGKE